ncbi:bifunctional MFS transporter/dTMP kinase [Amycolatopsis granulosa]|uniref:bifunctional MFS transporter/dTMP kinase n=1 Tax=Amycolatopsis granulosa TaxID=185684 RepID=UPI00142480A4|nr:dTMP kinase [Amycolatopsis granulosa]
MQGQPGAGKDAPAGRDTSTIHRARRVLAIRPFRRLWGITYLCSVADWLTLLGLSTYAAQMTGSYTAKNFAFTGVVLSALLPGLIFAPMGGLLADRFDRRKVMFVADLLRCGFLLSVTFVGTWWWLYIANFLTSASAMMWIPSKEAAVPNLLKRPDQVETANQLGMVMTYGLATVTAGGVYAVITRIVAAVGLPDGFLGELGVAKVIIVLIALLYLASGVLLLTRVPELSIRKPRMAGLAHEQAEKAAKPVTEDAPGLGALVKDAGKYIKSTPLVRGLLIGAAGAFAAGGAVVGSAQTYASSLNAGESTWGLLVVAVFIGLATGMGGAPKLARRLPHDRLFGISIVLAGLALILVALSPHVTVSLVAVAIVGACAGAAFLTGVTIIGSQVEDAIRGRINAIYQSMLKVIVFGSVSLVPLLIALTDSHRVRVWGNEITIDGTRPVMLGGGALAAIVGIIAYRQMDSRRSEPIMADLRNAIRRRPRRVNGLLIALEGTTVADTAAQATKLTEWLCSVSPRPVVLAADPALDDERLTTIIGSASLSGARAQALAAAAVRADIVERNVQPALDGGAIVVMERFVDSPLAHLSAVAGLDAKELEGLADWATGRLRPDVTVLLDADPGAAHAPGPISVETQWRVQTLLSEMAAADPDHYVVVDADAPEDAVADRVRTAVTSVLVQRKLGLAPLAESEAE